MHFICVCPNLTETVQFFEPYEIMIIERLNWSRLKLISMKNLNHRKKNNLSRISKMKWWKTVWINLFKKFDRINFEQKIFSERLACVAFMKSSVLTPKRSNRRIQKTRLVTKRSEFMALLKASRKISSVFRELYRLDIIAPFLKIICPFPVVKIHILV